MEMISTGVVVTSAIRTLGVHALLAMASNTNTPVPPAIAASINTTLTGAGIPTRAAAANAPSRI
jgi:hypothetical protein